MTYNIPDMDLDVKDRDEILKYFKYIPASKVSDNGLFPHGVGVYFCNIPNDLISGMSSIDYKILSTEAIPNPGLLIHSSL